MSKTKAQTDQNTPHSNLEHEEHTQKSEKLQEVEPKNNIQHRPKPWANQLAQSFSKSKIPLQMQKWFWEVKIVKTPNTFLAKPRAQKTKSQFNGEFTDYQNLKLHQKKPKNFHNILIPIPNLNSSLHFHCQRPRDPIRGPIFLDLHILIRW